jgi:hypothetical protein
MKASGSKPPFPYLNESAACFHVAFFVLGALNIKKTFWRFIFTGLPTYFMVDAVKCVKVAKICNSVIRFVEEKRLNTTTIVLRIPQA